MRYRFPVSLASALTWSPAGWFDSDRRSGRHFGAFLDVGSVRQPGIGWLDPKPAAGALFCIANRSAFELDGRALPDPEHVSLERIALSLGEADDPRDYEVEIATRLVVVTRGSLGRVAGLLAGESDSPLTRTLLDAIANDLTRAANGTCPVQPRR